MTKVQSEEQTKVMSCFLLGERTTSLLIVCKDGRSVLRNFKTMFIPQFLKISIRDNFVTSLVLSFFFRLRQPNLNTDAHDSHHSPSSSFSSRSCQCSSLQPYHHDLKCCVRTCVRACECVCVCVCERVCVSE